MNQAILRSSFELVVSRDPNVTSRFYEILFERHPEVERLFSRRPRVAQAKMLAEALTAVLDHLDDAPWLETQLTALGAKHVGYGVTPPMYAWVGEALLATLAETAGDDWTDEMAMSWGEAYGAISDLMLRGARIDDPIIEISA